MAKEMTVSWEQICYGWLPLYVIMVITGITQSKFA
jgi:hypothetical protein